MKLEKTIKKIYELNTDYNNPLQVINQANSLETLSSDLYTDAIRFIYELLQNADDSSIKDKSVQVEINLIDNILMVAHTGKIFDNKDIEGICGINNGTKKSSKEKTGYKGIGFKSVFGKSKEVIIYSDNEYFKFDANYDFEWKDIWGGSKIEWEKINERKFLYPWQIIPIYIFSNEVDTRVQNFIQENQYNVVTIIKLSKKEDIKKSIKTLYNNINMFLFLKNIDNIIFNIDKINNISINRISDKIILKQNNKIINEWIIYNTNLKVPNSLKKALKKEDSIPDKLTEAKTIRLTLAIKKTKKGLEELTDNENLLYSYLPTDEKRYNLPVLVNTSFLTTANRESLHSDSKLNEWLFENISIELFKWITILVQKEYSYQAYQVIPIELSLNDNLAQAYNRGIKKGKEEIAFILSKDDKLLKYDEIILDYTNLSEKNFIGSDIIRKFIIDKNKNNSINKNPFIKNTKFNKYLEKLDISTFKIKDILPFFSFEEFSNNHSIDDNIQLIEYFKNLVDIKDKYISEDKIKEWNFILDDKHQLNYPDSIYLSITENNNEDSNISFVHKEIQEWLLKNTDIKKWLDKIGLVEKTDISFLEKTIIPNSETYATIENSLSTMQDIFKLYSKNIIDKEILNKLSDLKLITKKGNLLKASDCYFSNNYNPKLKIEETISEDIFLNEDYLVLDKDVDEIKRFFKYIGLKEEIEIINFEEKISQSELIKKYNFQEDYFKIFNSGYSHLKADTYKNIITLSFLNKLNNFKFSKLFWNNIIKNINLRNLTISAIAYWGYIGMSSRTVGNKMENYLKWYIQNNNCIPTKQENCKKSIEVFLNSKEIIDIAGNYLPIFDGDELSSDWKSFFEFKTQLELKDYLELLSNIIKDENKDNKIKRENKDRIQSIYAILLDLSENFSKEEIEEIQIWSKTASFTNIENIICKSKELKYYTDGDNSIFQDMYQFINLNSENKNHYNIEKLLNYFDIDIVRQSDFEIIYKNKKNNSTLKEKISNILPYLENWLDKENEKYDNLQDKLKKLEIIEADDLKLYYNKELLKSIQTHLNNNIFYVSNPWKKNKIFITLPKLLCSYFEIKGNDKKIDFLLRAENYLEINEYFEDENIEIPEGIITKEKKDLEKKSKEINILEDIILSMGITSEDEFKKAIKENPNLQYVSTNKTSFKEVLKKLERARDNMIKHLKNLPEYNCTNIKKIDYTILSGIIKNNQKINIVIRPSDNNKIIIYYDIEKSTLKNNDSELWYENGISLPKRLTIGNILENTEINQIPIKNE